jgi:hypothetical protein
MSAILTPPNEAVAPPAPRIDPNLWERLRQIRGARDVIFAEMALLESETRKLVCRHILNEFKQFIPADRLPLKRGEWISLQTLKVRYAKQVLAACQDKQRAAAILMIHHQTLTELLNSQEAPEPKT